MLSSADTLRQFRTEVSYLADNTYFNTGLDIDRVDPVSGGRASQWQKMAAVIAGLGNTSGKEALFRTYLDRFARRPATTAEAYAVLVNMRDTADAILACLALGEEEQPAAPRKPRQRPRLEYMGRERLEHFHEGTLLDGPVIEVEELFYGRLGRKPLDHDAMMDLWQRQDTFGRVALTPDGRRVLGHYICEQLGCTLRVVDWAFRPQPAPDEHGVPDALLRDLLDYAGPKAPLGRRYDRIEQAVLEQHPEDAPAAPPPGQSWRDRPALF